MSLVLTINNEKVTNEQLLPLLAQYGMIPQLAKEIIIEKAIADIECSEEEKIAAQKQFFSQHKITDEQQLEAWLTKQGLKAEQLEKILYKRIKIEKYKQQTWGNQLENYFLKRKGQLDQVIYSLIRTKDVGIAQELYFRIKDREATFAELANKYSEGQEAQTGGLIGPVELNNPHPIVAQMLTASTEGQLWPPNRVGDWWIIVKLEKNIPANLDERMRQRLLDELFQNWIEQEMQENSTLSWQESETTDLVKVVNV